MSGSNVVPMHTPWPMPPGGFPAGCCPPGGMDALLQCYCDIQAATAFISKVVTDLAANDPAFQKALVDGIVASGSNIPLIGVTNGASAQPGQVGEIQQFSHTVTYTGTGAQETSVFTMGVIPPGDWDIWLYVVPTTSMIVVSVACSPLPPDMSNNLWTGFGVAGGFGGPPGTGTTVEGVGALPGPIATALWSAPQLIALQSIVVAEPGTAGLPGTMQCIVTARRRR